MKISHFVSIITIITVNGCASVAVTDSAILENTAVALATSPSNITISNRVDNGVQTSYIAKTTNGKTYSCYLTGTFYMLGPATSQAMCNDEQGKTLGNDNALIRNFNNRN